MAFERRSICTWRHFVVAAFVAGVSLSWPHLSLLCRCGWLLLVVLRKEVVLVLWMLVLP